MELTPQQIDAARTQAEIDRQVRRHFSSQELARMEKRALVKHPPVFRQTQPVPPAIRKAELEMLKPKRQTKRKQHVLP